MSEHVTIRVPRWLAYPLAAVLLMVAGVGAGLAVGGDGSDASVATEARPKRSTTTSTSTSTTSTTAAPAPIADGGDRGGNAGGGGNGDGGQAGQVAPPAPPAATADVTKSAGCPTIVTWNGTGGTNGYTLQVYNAVPGGAMLHNGPVAANGAIQFECAGADPGVPRVGLVRFNTNTATGTVSDTA